jgi:hypothetical protein
MLGSVAGGRHVIALPVQKILPPLYYGGSDFTSFSSPRSEKPELLIETFAT